MIKQVYWPSDEEWKRIEPLAAARRRSAHTATPVFKFSVHTLLSAAAACTMPDLWHAIVTALKDFSLDECQNYLAAAGYDATARKML